MSQLLIFITILGRFAATMQQGRVSNDGSSFVFKVIMSIVVHVEQIFVVPVEQIFKECVKRSKTNRVSTI